MTSIAALFLAFKNKATLSSRNGLESANELKFVDFFASKKILALALLQLWVILENAIDQMRFSSKLSPDKEVQQTPKV